MADDKTNADAKALADAQKAAADAAVKSEADAKALADANAKMDALKAKLAEAEAKALDMSGGATSEPVQVEVNQPKETDEDTIPIITTDVGSFGMLGLVEVGTPSKVTLTAFSYKWMKPATKDAAAKLNKYKAAKDAAAKNAKE